MYEWIDKKDTYFKNLFGDAVKKCDGLSVDNSLLDCMSKPPLNEELVSNFAQYFTPSDVALYTAYNLFQGINNIENYIVFDPAFGNGCLLIASAYILHYKYGLSNIALLDKLHGSEICEKTRNAGIHNLYQAISEYLPNVSESKAIRLLERNLIAENFLKYTSQLEKKILVITNPPYKEDKSNVLGSKNIWIDFMSKILKDVQVMAVGAILPVSICCANRTKELREIIKEDFKKIKLLHHDTRPRPLFPKVEQRITILNVRRSTKSSYETTGFLTHKAKDRQSIWNSEFTQVEITDCIDCFPKVYPYELDFFNKVNNGSLTINNMKKGLEIEYWIRTSGRYSLSISKNKPEQVTSKWKKIVSPEQQFLFVKECFENGNALKWWKIFGDGRDFSINKFFNSYGV